MEKLINEFLNNNRVFTINSIDVIRDSETIILESYTGERLKFYMDNNSYALHTSYPITEENILTDMPTVAWIYEQVNNYLEKQQTEVQFITVIKNRLRSKYSKELK